MPENLPSQTAAPATDQPSPARVPPGRRPKVVILNQYYVPDVASTGHLLHELAVDLVKRGFGVKVITSRPSYGPPETWQAAPYREVSEGVEVRRARTTRMSKDWIVGRAINFLTFIVPLQARMLVRARRHDVHLYTTNPPFLGIIGAVVSLVRRHNYVLLLHDAYPQMAVWVGTIAPGGLIDRFWHAMNKLTYRRANQTIVLCQAAKKLVCDTYKVDPARVHVVPNWADGELLSPRPKAQSAFAREHGLVEPFTLLYSGNLGLYYEFETVLGAAERLMGENFRLVFVGSGGRRPWLAEQIARRKLTNTLLLPYVPFERLNESLNSCDASLVTIAKGIEGISFPSKLYSSLAVGKPIVALSEERSELKELVQQRDVGRWFALGDADGLAQGLRAMMADVQGRARQAANARRLFESRYTVDASVARYADVLRHADALARGESTVMPADPFEVALRGNG
jgi:glycosyltransferase involved in cell wall biosynthesis